MPFAIELSLDDETEAVVRGLWQALAAAGIADWQPGSAARPHVTLAVYDALDVPAMSSVLAGIAATIEPLPITFASYGCFPTEPAVVFLAPVLTQALLSAHARVQAALASAAAAAWTHYLPEHWVPHCTLAMELPVERIAPAIDLCRRVPLPLSGRLNRLGLVEFRPVVERAVFRLGA
jgi:2'-5' RNA ligase